MTKHNSAYGVFSLGMYWFRRFKISSENCASIVFEPWSLRDEYHTKTVTIRLQQKYTKAKSVKSNI